MKRLLRMAARLYPSHWRDRYGAEFDALIEDSDSNWRDVLDVVKGALSMRLKDRGLIVAAFALSGGLIAGFSSLGLPDNYSSTAQLSLQSTNDAGLVQRLCDASFTGHSLAGIIRSERLYGFQSGRGDRTVKTMTEKLRRSIRFHIVAPTDAGDMVFRLEVVDQDRAKARQVSGDLVAQMMEANTNPATASGKTLRQITAPDPATAVSHAWIRCFSVAWVAPLDSPWACFARWSTTRADR